MGDKRYRTIKHSKIVHIYIMIYNYFINLLYINNYIHIMNGSNQ